MWHRDSVGNTKCVCPAQAIGIARDEMRMNSRSFAAWRKSVHRALMGEGSPLELTRLSPLASILGRQ
eukprot:4450359-Pleurochrysis_carterae.AAC.4